MELRCRIRHATAKRLGQHSSYIYGIRGAFSTRQVSGPWLLGCKFTERRVRAGLVLDGSLITKFCPG